MTRREVLRRATVAAAGLALPGVLTACRDGKSTITAPRSTQAGAELPQDGRPLVAGITLPAGRRWASDLWDVPAPDVAWCTDAGVDGAFDLARRLAAAFPETGLWPCIWDWPDRPSPYFDAPPRTSGIDARKAGGALEKGWLVPGPPRREWVSPFGTRFPGLAKPTMRRGGFDPFALLEARQQRDARWQPEALKPRLMLVPCSRPADIIARTGAICGTGYTGLEDQVLVSSVLRSWEDRFGAVLVGLAPAYAMLAVAGPPRTLDHALHIAAEQYALAPRDDAGAPGAMQRAARDLLDPAPYDSNTSRDVWGLAWGD